MNKRNFVKKLIAQKSAKLRERLAEWNRQHPDESLQPKIKVRVRIPLAKGRQRTFDKKIRLGDLWLDDHSK